MKILFESAFTINQEIKRLINKEGLESFSNSIYQGDNANYCVSLFHDFLIENWNLSLLFLDSNALSGPPTFQNHISHINTKITRKPQL